MNKLGILAIGLMIGAGIGVAGSFAPQVLGHSANPNQPYKDEQGRLISSLSSKDVEDLKAGRGWGLAKPAEFNGYPGPAHVIEFARSLELTDQQLTSVKASFTAMQKQAAQLGEQLIAAEKALDGAFVSKRISRGELNRLLAQAESVRAQLRAVHLSAHLEVTPMLSDEQKKKYAQLRGYGSNGHGGHGSH